MRLKNILRNRFQRQNTQCSSSSSGKTALSFAVTKETFLLAFTAKTIDLCVFSNTEHSSGIKSKSLLVDINVNQQCGE